MTPQNIKLRSTRYDLPALFDALRYEVGVEAGVQHGYYSRYILEHSRIKRLYSVDPWDGRFGKFEADARHYLAQFEGRSEIIKARSDQAAQTLRDNNVRLDFVYIDADHRQYAVTHDIAAWLPLVRPGGMLCGHDYVVAPRTGVIEAVDAFASSKGWPLFLTSEPWASWIIFVPEP